MYDFVQYPYVGTYTCLNFFDLLHICSFGSVCCVNEVLRIGILFIYP